MAKRIDDCETPEELSEAISEVLKRGGMRTDIYDDKTGFVKTVHNDHETQANFGSALNKYSELCKSDPQLPPVKIDASDPLLGLAQLKQRCLNIKPQTAVNENEAKILDYLDGEYPQLRNITEMKEATKLDRKTIRKYIHSLRAKGLVTYDTASVNTYTLTPKGRHYVSEYFS
jgi:predicted transcriptional regulator